MSQSLSQAIWIFICLISNYLLTINAQKLGEKTNTKLNSKLGNTLNLIINGLILFLLLILFIYSMRYSPKCRRRRRKLPHEIRLEKTNKQIKQQLEYNNNNININDIHHDEYICENTAELNDNDNENQTDTIDINDIINEDSNSYTMVNHSKLLVNNINHYIQSQYDEYRDTHSHIVHD
eukprot:735188_1